MYQINNSDEISLNAILTEIKTIIKYLVSKWIILCIISIIGIGLGYIYAKKKKSIYTAVTTFVLEEGDGGGGNLGKYAGLASMAGVDIGANGGGIFQGDNIIQLYKSRTMIVKTLFSEVEVNNKKQLLIERYVEFNKLNEAWKDKEEIKKFKFNPGRKSNRLQDSLLMVVYRDISANYLTITKPDKLLNIIKAQVSGPDEVFVKLFNERIVENVNDFYIQTKTKKSLQNIKILQKKTDSVKAVMNGAIYSAAVAIDLTPNLNPTKQTQRTAPVQRSQFSAETNKQIFAELTKNLELSKLALQKEIPLIQVIDGPVYPLEITKLSLTKGSIIGCVFGFVIGCLFLLVVRFVKENRLEN